MVVLTRFTQCSDWIFSVWVNLCSHWQLVVNLYGLQKLHLGPCRTIMMKLFVKIVNGSERYSKPKTKNHMF